jgi:hypothetical protein
MRFFAAALLAAALAGLLPLVAFGAGVVSSPDRAAIDRTLDVFVAATLRRQNAARAWKLATPALHLGGTRASWARGELPVAPFPAAGSTFHDWTVDTARPRVVDLVLLVHPRKGARVGAISFNISMRKLHGAWLVDSFVPAAFFAPAGARSGILAAPDLAPGPPGSQYSRSGRIGQGWILVVGGALLGVVVLLPVLLVGGHRLRDRRARRRYASVTRGV